MRCFSEMPFRLHQINEDRELLNPRCGVTQDPAAGHGNGCVHSWFWEQRPGFLGGSLFPIVSGPGETVNMLYPPPANRQAHGPRGPISFSFPNVDLFLKEF